MNPMDNEENLFITNISKYITSKNFIEIGYHYREMNFIVFLYCYKHR